LGAFSVPFVIAIAAIGRAIDKAIDDSTNKERMAQAYGEAARKLNKNA